MGLVVIPADFDERVSTVVPIFVQDEDPQGNRIARGWIDAVVRAADKLRGFSRRLLFDEWRVSELADETIQDLWCEHGEDLGWKPHRRVIQHAEWKALDKSAGSIRARKGLDVELLEHVLCVQEPGNFASDLEKAQLLDRLVKRLTDLGLRDVRQILELALHNGDFNFVSEIGESENTVKKRFWRAIRKAGRLL